LEQVKDFSKGLSAFTVIRKEFFMPKMIMLIGAPASGKSSWVTENSKNFMVASTDDIIEDWGKEVGMSYHEAFAHFDFGKANTKMLNTMRQGIKRGDSVIIDRTNMTIKGRAKFLKMFPNTYEKIAIVFENDYETLKARLIKREEETDKHIPNFVLSKMLNSYQRPTPEESFNKIIDIKN
jgi:predicted kinase